VAGAREPVQVRAQLGYDDLGAPPGDPRDRI
jgi:hypothetical protein